MSTIVPVYYHFFVIECIVAIEFSKSEKVFASFKFHCLQTVEVCKVSFGLAYWNVLFIYFPL